MVLVEGEPALYMERGGKIAPALALRPGRSAHRRLRLLAAAEALASAARAGSLGTVTVERVNGAAALTSPLRPAPGGSGVHRHPRGPRIRA
ncbi:hypothetical protein LV779_06265 [Streptomyces thinghirensis]|nr:hypothetical protein [Streptomyces thinghirensis]